jgi:hypothetical protein
MTRRLYIASAAGGICLLSGFGALQYAIQKSRPLTDDEWRRGQREQAVAASRADMRRLLLEGISNAVTEKDRKISEYDYRLFNFGETHRDFSSLYDTKAEIGEFQAYLFSKLYFSQTFGMCGNVDLPEKKGNEWVAAIAVGRESERAPSIHIDAKSRTLRCEGHPTIPDLAMLLVERKPPNHVPDPTSPSVTPPAGAGGAPSVTTDH